MKLTICGIVPLVLASAAWAAPHVLEIDEPVLAPEEGLFLGNGDLSVSAYQTADAIVFRLGKGDVWDRRLDLSKNCRPAHIQEFIDGELKEGWKTSSYDDKETVATKGTKNEKRMRELCKGASEATELWPYPCPKPTGELRLHLPTDLPGPMRIVQRVVIEEARLEIVCTWRNGMRLDVEAVIPPEENVLSLSWKIHNWNGKDFIGSHWNETMPVWFSLWRWQDPDWGAWAARQFVDSGHMTHLDRAKINHVNFKPLPAPRAFMEGSVGCIEQGFYPDNLFKDGFRYRMSLRMDPEKYGATEIPDLGGFTKDAWILARPAKGDGAGELALAVTTSRDKTLAAPAARSHGAYRAETLAAGKAYWSQRAFAMPNDAFLEKLWYATCHARRCILKGGTVPPGLFFPSTVQDFSHWHGDYHSNYNLQSIYWGAFTANQMREQAACFDCIEFFLPLGRKIARDYYGARGFYTQLAGFPLLSDDDYNGNLPSGRMAYMTGWIVAPYFEWYKSTLDLDWLRTRGYPVIRDAALFYLDFLKKAPNENLPPQLKDGKYHFFPSIQGEDGFSGDPMDVCDKPQGLHHCRHALWMAVEASKALGVDADLRAQWQDRIDNLAGLKPRAAYTGPRADYEYWCALAMSPEFGGESWAPPPAWDGQPRKVPGNDSWYQGCATMWRTGQVRSQSCVPERDYAFLRERLGRWTHPNGLVWAMAIANYGRSGAWTESLSSIAPIQEMLLQSWDGSLRLFSRWPKSLDVSFANWRAQGAFLVSGEQKAGKVSVTILSEQGAPCVLSGEWTVTDNAGKPVATDRDPFGRLRFKTEKGQSYRLF